MSKVSADTLKSLDSTQDLTIGTTGQTVTLPGNELRVNTFKDKGWNTLWTSDGSGNLSSVNSALKGNMTLLNTTTASGVANVTFGSSLITSTYDLYIFRFTNINPETDNTQFWFQGTIDGGSNYNVTMTTTAWMAYHNESGAGTEGLQYLAGSDQGQGTAFQKLSGDIGNGADESTSGELHLFTPSSTTYVKQFYNRTQELGAGNQAGDLHYAGYFNTTSAINGIQFKMSTGNLDGIFKLYGLS